MSKRASLKITGWTASTYFGQGLPWSFLHQMGTEYLTAIGAPIAQIGYTSWLHLAVTAKFLWSPVVDLFGSKRTWMLVMQAVLGVGMLVVAAISGLHSLKLFWVCLGGLAILHATHDIACDGFYIFALDKQARALYLGIQVAAFRLAMLVGSGALVYLAGRTSWTLGFGAAGLLMLVVAAGNTLVVPQVEETAPEVDSVDRDRESEFFAAYRSFFSQPQAILVVSFMLFYRLGDIMMFAMSKPLLRDIGIDTAHRGLVGGISIGVFITGSMLGGALVARHGLERCLVPITYFQNLAIPLYVLMALVRPGFCGVVGIVSIEQFAAGIGASTMTSFLMQRCRRAFSSAHFAFATAIVALTSTLSGAISGHLNGWLGHPRFFMLAFVASWPSLVLVLLVPRTPLEN